MPRVKLTKSVIDALPTPSKDEVYWDTGCPGFGVKVTPKGRKVFVPDGFAVGSAIGDGDTTLITVRPTSRTSACPRCGTRSERIHSRYLRHATDLPLAGRPVRLVVVARRFRCDAPLCGRRIFTERFSDG